MSLLKKRSIATFLICGLFVANNVMYSFASTEENGFDHIGDSPNKSRFTRAFDSYRKNANFQLYNEVPINMHSGPSKSSKVLGSISPQLLTSTTRSGDWFLIKSYAGDAWVYDDNNVLLREIENMSNDLFTTSTNLNLYSYPFGAYPNGQSIPAGTYSILKKAGDWFYINTGTYNGWFNTSKGYFNNSISTLNTSKVNNIPLNVKLANYSSNVRPGTPLKPKYITIHNTANTGKGANAKAHANLLSNNNNGRTASWHFTVDDREIYQSLPLNEVGFHAGDGSGPGNRSSIGIEICENSDGNYLKAEQNAAELTAKLLRELNLPLSSVKKHQDFSGKFCPAKILGRNNGWNEFMSKVEKAYNSMSSNIPVVDPSNATYYLDINSFLGDYSVDTALQKLQNDTGWYVEKHKIGNGTPIYEVETGGFIGEENIKSAVDKLKSQTGLDATYSPNGVYVDGNPLPIYMIETGGFYGEENVKESLKKIQDETGWWGTYRANETLDNTYHILLGGFDGDASVQSALNKLQSSTGWWAHYYTTGEFTSASKVPVYSMQIGNILSISDAQNTVKKLQDLNGWWSHYYNTGSTLDNYRIITGGFGGLHTANQKAEYVRNNYGWYTEVKPQ